MRPRGASLTEMLFLVAGVACLVFLFLPVFLHARDASERTECSSHLYRIGQGLLIYAAEHDGYLPDVGASSPLGGPPPSDRRHVPGRTDAPGTGAWPAVRAVGNQANLWVLVREGMATPELFVCPATSDRPSLNTRGTPGAMGFLELDRSTGATSDAEDDFLRNVAAGRCSYSYQNQFVHPDTDPAVADPRGATTHRTIHPQDLAVVADRNPYTRPQFTRQLTVSPHEEPEANSPNHLFTGQNVLYLSGRVEWHTTPLAGPRLADGTRDNIYTAREGDPADPANVPRDLDDSYLVP